MDEQAFITPVVGTRYWLAGEQVEVVEALKRRYWRIVVLDIGSLREPYPVTQATWAAKASTVGPQ